MRIPNQLVFLKITYNHSSHIDFKDFMILYKKCTAKPCSFLVIDDTFASGNPLRFGKSFKKNIKTNHDC